MYEKYNKTKDGFIIHTEHDFIKMRAAGRLAAQLLDFIVPQVKTGVSTLYLNDICHDFIIKHGAIPAPLNYKGFPKSICTSVNHVVCHGIPSETKILKDGDIINIDVTVILDGYFGDSSRMYYVGNPSIQASRLCDATYKAMMAGINVAQPGNTLRDIAIAIEGVIGHYGYSIVQDFCGHGIGKVFHMDPQIMHCNDKSHGYQDAKIVEGMCFTIEPMINVGKHPIIISKIDGWTVITRDKSLSAQWEHTIGITKDGAEIFTVSQ